MPGTGIHAPRRLPRGGAHYPCRGEHPRYPKLRQGRFFPNRFDPRRRVDKALYAVMIEAYTDGIYTRKVQVLAEEQDEASAIFKSEISRMGQGVDEQMKAFMGWPLEHARFPYVTSTPPTSTADSA
jgi:transposase-like protein